MVGCFAVLPERSLAPDAVVDLKRLCEHTKISGEWFIFSVNEYFETLNDEFAGAKG